MTNEEAAIDTRSPEEISRDYYVASGRANSAPSQATLDRIDATERVEQAPAPSKLPSISDPDPVREAAQDRLIDKQRKKRSDAGIPKRPPADPDEITLKLTLDDARQAAFQLSDSELTSHIATKVQDQIIGCLQKRLDQLSKQK